MSSRSTAQELRGCIRSRKAWDLMDAIITSDDPVWAEDEFINDLLAAVQRGATRLDPVSPPHHPKDLNMATALHDCAECRARELLSEALRDVVDDRVLLAEIDERLDRWRDALDRAEAQAGEALERLRKAAENDESRPVERPS